MPILIKEYSWHQTPLKVFLDIPLDTKKYKSDIFITEEYLKISALPYLFEVFLCNKIDVDKSHGKVTESSVKLELCKQIPQQNWDALNLINLDRNSAKTKRQEAVEWRQKYEQDKTKEKETNERVRERKACENSLEAYEEHRKRIENQIKESKANFFKEDEVKKSEEKVKLKVDFNTELAAKVAKENDRMSSLPPVRNSGLVEFNFSSQRQFPAPLRETNKEMEEKWIKQQKEAWAKMSTKGIEEGMEPEDLLRKAENFFKIEDYDSALEAYTFGIQSLCPNYAPIWNNRSVVHLKLGNFHEAIRDASKALQLMDPPVKANEVMRAKAYIRRGTALRELKDYDNALREFQEAQKILPEDKEIAANMKTIESLKLNYSSSSESETED